MVVREYRKSGSSKQVAGIIAGEVIESGKSDGWQGSLEELSQIENILSNFNICYVSDLFGEWAYRQRERGTSPDICIHTQSLHTDIFEWPLPCRVL